MTNDMSVLSLSAVTPVSRKDDVSPGRTVQGAAVNSVKAEQRVAGTTSAEKPAETGGLEESVQDLNSLVQELQRELRFSVDDESGETVVKVVDRQTDEVVRQIPSEEILRLREKLEAATGALFSGKA